MSPIRPTPREQRARQTARIKAMEHQLDSRRRELKERLKRRRPLLLPRGVEKPPQKRRRWWLLLVLILLLLWLLLPDCGEPAVPEAPSGPAITGVGAPVPPLPPPPEPLTGTVKRRERPAYDGDPAGPLPWIGSFRIQVGARSPRLAACFVGAERPGRLKWTASVEPTRGQVSDHTVEPTLLSDELTQAQRTCVVGVLSDPPYKLEGDDRATPSRVSMVIEF